MVKFVIIRHGYSIYNKAKKFTGQTDIPLDELGLEQAKDTAEYVLQNYKIDKIYSSDLIRAIDTAKPVAEALGLPINKDPDLREINAGCWEGRYIADLKVEYLEAFKKWATDVGLARCGDGESSKELSKRCEKVFRKIAKENEGKTVLVATHGGVVRAIRCSWLGIPLSEMKNVPHVSNSSVTVAEYDNETDTAKFTLIGYDGHLKDKVTEFTIAV